VSITPLPTTATCATRTGQTSWLSLRKVDWVTKLGIIALQWMV